MKPMEIQKVYINSGENHHTSKIPDFILLRECKKENRKLKTALINKDNDIAKLYKKLEDAYVKIEEQSKIINSTDFSEIKEDILSLKREEHYTRQQQQITSMSKSLHELRKLVDKTVWKQIKNNNNAITMV